MAIIALEGMRFYAKHGYYPEEQVLGNEFILDIIVTADTSAAAEADDLYVVEEEEEKAEAATLNYETIYLLCQAEMRKPARMLETIVERIADRIEEHFDNCDGVLVRLQKLHPPLAGFVGQAWVAIARGDLDLSYLQLVTKLGK